MYCTYLYCTTFDTKWFDFKASFDPYHVSKQPIENAGNGKTQKERIKYEILVCVRSGGSGLFDHIYSMLSLATT